MSLDLTRLSGDGQTRNIGNVEEQRAKIAQKCEAIILYRRIVGHDHNVVEKHVDGLTQRSQGAERFGVSVLDEQRLHSVAGGGER